MLAEIEHRVRPARRVIDQAAEMEAVFDLVVVGRIAVSGG
jgi:hypothetical protein